MRHNQHITLASAQVEEDYGNRSDDRKDPKYWRVNLPSDELENFMWGGQGVPTPVSTPTPKFQKSWAKREYIDGLGDQNGVCITDIGQEDSNVQNNDNISMAIDSTISSIPNASTDDDMILDDIVWKQRSGFGKYYMGILNHEWEQRRVALFASGKLRYYALAVSSPRTAAKNADQNQWEFKTEPRGELVLNSKVKVKARRRSDSPGPTPFEIDLIHRETHEIWRFCFISQSIQAEWMSYFKQKTKPADAEYSDDSDDEDLDETPDVLDNHGLKPGDHIIRWEMLPIIYPIQIHGIVLEAGKNCLIIADFGLTSHGSHGNNKELDTFKDADQSQDFVMQAWEKIKPKEKKRLNIIALTDPKEIRKWSKISYGDRVEENEKEKTGFLKSILGGKSPKTPTKKKKTVDMKQDGTDEKQQLTDDIGNLNLDIPIVEAEKQIKDLNSIELDNCEVEKVNGEPEWFYSGYRARARTGSSDAPIIIEDSQSVFNVDHPVDKISTLPKSDSAKLVLARTHFILENEDLLPPYHVSIMLTTQSLIVSGLSNTCCTTRINLADLL